MPVRVWAVACVLALVTQAVPASAAGDSQPIITDIVVEGGVTLTLDTVSYYLGLEPGDPLDPDAIATGFHRLWDSALFEDLRIEAETVGEGEVKLYIEVVERPFVSSVVFEGNKKVSTTTLKDKLDEKGIDLPRNVPLKLSLLSRLETEIKEIYDAEGYRSAVVSHRIEEINKKERRVVFSIQEGGKVKIKRIDFAGNEVFSDRRLRGALKKTKQTSLWRIFGKSILFSDERWVEDRENLRKFYMNHGYKDIKVGSPQIEVVAKRPQAETLKKKKYRMHITVPVEEGLPYALGSLEVKGVTIFNAEALKRGFEIEPGERYNFKAIDDGMEAIRDIYHNRGYIYAYTNQVVMNREGADQVVDVTVDVFEGDRFRLSRLEFSGNTRTNEKVLRREFRIGEGDWMSMGIFKSSVYKVNALGYWKLEEEPLDFDFDEEEKRVNVTVKGKEVGRNDIQFGAGYSELDGFFVQALFNTRNFLGRGETLGVSVQTGGRADYYSLSFTEPYFLDRRILLGGAIFRNSTDIADFYRETTGASVSFGLGLGLFTSFSSLIAYEDVYSRYAITRTGLPGDLSGGHERPLDPPPIPGQEVRDIAYEVYKGRTTSITPAIGMDSRDDPFDPSRGLRTTVRARFAGGPLGGDFDYIRPEASFTLFRPLSKKWIFAVNVEAGEFFPYGGSPLPLYELYRLGGDRSLRGLPYYSVLPRTAEGDYFYTPGGSRMGGDRYWQTNVELQFKLGGPVKLVTFTDLGNTYDPDQGWDLGLYRKTAGLELRLFLPIFQAPIRFIYGYNLDPFPDEDQSDFQFSIGTTF